MKKYNKQQSYNVLQKIKNHEDTQQLAVRNIEEKSAIRVHVNSVIEAAM